MNGCSLFYVSIYNILGRKFLRFSHRNIYLRWVIYSVSQRIFHSPCIQNIYQVFIWTITKLKFENKGNIITTTEKIFTSTTLHNTINFQFNFFCKIGQRYINLKIKKCPQLLYDLYAILIRVRNRYNTFYVN